MSVDIVLMPAPLVKCVTTKSSTDIVNERSAPDIIPGMSSGRTTFLKAYGREAPRSIAASKRVSVLLLSLGRTESITYGIQNVTCENSIVI